MNTQRIPLFPLNVVLFPGRILPLRIFEPRYKQMIRQAVDREAPFGVVLARENGIAPVGCTAEVAQVLKTHEDGRMDIVTQGRTVYQIHALHEEKPCLEGTVEMLEDDLDPGPAGVAEELGAIFSKCHMLLHGGPPSREPDHPGVSLAYRIAGEIPLELDDLQELLEIRQEAERRRRLA